MSRIGKMPVPILKGIEAKETNGGLSIKGPKGELSLNVHTDMNVVMLAGGGLIEVQATAEAAPFDRRQTDRLLDLAQGGVESLHDAQRGALS